MSRVCPTCGTENEPTVRICVQCAAALGNFCPGCGFENPVGFKFCGNCGFNLQAPPPKAEPVESPVALPTHPVLPEALAQKVIQQRGMVGERREVTVLFADMHGFTGLAEQFDPETVYTLVNRYLQEFVTIIHTYEGTVDKFTGDGLMALFGAPIAVENHAERACRAAIEMQSALADLSPEMHQLFGREVRLRIGLNSGAVIAGIVGADSRFDYTVIGDTVNVASRLESLADPGTVLVSQTVYELTKPLCDFMLMGPVTVKGRRDPVQTYHLIGLKAQPEPTRGIPGIRAPLMGRETEVAALTEVARRLEAGTGQIVLIAGEAGLGKSRLTAEFRQQLSPEVRVAEGACLSYRQTVSYWPFIAIFRQLLTLSETMPSQQAWEHLVERIEALGLEVEDIAPFLASMLDIPILNSALRDPLRYLAPAQVRQQLFLAVRQVMRAIARQHPLLLIFEDLHWSDAASLDLLLFLSEGVTQAPLGLYCITRNFQGEAIERLTKSFQKAYSSLTTILTLTPLDSKASANLLGALLAIPDLPDELLGQLPAQSEGNPFFLEELVRLLIERNIIYRVGNQWRLTPGTEVRRLEVPSSLNALLMTRVDRLPAEARQVLQVAAVIGRSFALSLLQQVVQAEHSDISFYPALQRIEEAALIRRWQSPTAEGVEHTFRHALVRDIVYNSLLRERRVLLHRRVAEVIEGAAGENLERQIEIVAHHYVEGQAFDRAFPYLVRAGKRAAERFDNHQALAFLREAKRLTTILTIEWEERVDLNGSMADLLFFIGDTEQALALYQESLTELIVAGGRPWLSAELHRKIGRVYEKRSDYDEASRWYGLGLAELELEDGHDWAVERARIYNDLGWAAFRKGDFERGRSWALKSLELVEGTEHVQDLASAYNRLIGIYISGGDWSQALAVGRRSLALRKKMGFTHGLPGTYNNLAGLSLILGQWSETAEYLEQAQRLSEKIGYQEGILMVLLNLATLYRMQGNLAGAAEMIVQARPLALALKNPWHLYNSHTAQSHLALLQQEWVGAHEQAKQALQIAQQIEAKESEAEGLCLVADALLGQGMVEEALDISQQALALAEEIKSKTVIGAAHRAVGKCWHSVGKLDVAEQHLRKSEQAYLDYNDRYEVARTRFLLSKVRAVQGALKEADMLLQEATQTFEALGAVYDMALVNNAPNSGMPQRNGRDPSLQNAQNSPQVKAAE